MFICLQIYIYTVLSCLSVYRYRLSFLLQTVLFIYSALQLQVCLIKSVRSNLKGRSVYAWVFLKRLPQQEEKQHEQLDEQRYEISS